MNFAGLSIDQHEFFDCHGYRITLDAFEPETRKTNASPATARPAPGALLV